MTRRAIHVLCLVVALTGCKKPGEKQKGSSSATASAAPSLSSAPSPKPSAALPSAVVSSQAPVKRVELEVGANGATMAFDKTALSVPAAAEVHLVFKNSHPGTLPHNWVLVKPGTEAAVAAAGLAKGEKGQYIAPGPDVLAHTDLVRPGSSAEVTFTAPAPGSYPYICTFPGHYLVMKGVLTVTP